MRIIFIFTLILLFIFTPTISALNKVKNSPITLTWTQLPTLLAGCGDTAGVYYNNLYYQICGEYSGGDYSHLQIFNGSSWSESSATHPGGGVYYHSAAILNGNIVISGGSKFFGYYNFTTVYNISNSSWINSTPMPQLEMTGTAMASYQGKCYLFGGIASGSFILSNTYQWTPGDTAMTQVAYMPDCRVYLSAAECNGIIYVFGGCNPVTDAKNNIWAYNPILNTWTVKSTHLLFPVESATAVTVGDNIFIIGGYPFHNPNIQVYDTVTNTVISATSIPVQTGGHASAGYITENSNTSYIGHIYVSGGNLGHSAYIGTVSGVYCDRVQPASLGSIKACYH